MTGLLWESCSLSAGCLAFYFVLCFYSFFVYSPDKLDKCTWPDNVEDLYIFLGI